MKRKFLVPEAVQTSAMDCGPASLKALLEGFGIPVSYGRLREACQTDVDGTSIDNLEDAARQLGLDASQVMVPVEQLLGQLPALIVVRMPSGPTHFVVAWRQHGPWLQLMDPAAGRRWASKQAFLAQVFRHTQSIPAEAWRDWAASDGFQSPLRKRMSAMGIPAPEISATADWKILAAVDAAVRMLEALVAAGAVKRGRVAARIFEQVLTRPDRIPAAYWSAKQDPDCADNIHFTGAVLLSVQGKVKKDAKDGTAGSIPVSPELAAALAEKPSRPGRDILRMLFADGLAIPSLLITALAIASATVVVEAILYRGLFDIGRELTTLGQRLGAFGALLVLGAAMLLVESSIAATLLRMGRKLESRLRVAFLRKIPRLGDRYLQSRPASDMASRSHNVHQLRQAPEMSGHLLRTVFEMVLTVIGIAWLFPESALASAVLATVAIGIPLAAQPVLSERDLRVRSHTGALTRYYLDALLGLTAVRAHGAEQALRREQEGLLAEWAHAALGLQRAVVATDGLQFACSIALAAWILLSRLSHGGSAGGILLLIYWILNLPVLGQEAASIAWQYPAMRNTALRFIEPLGAREECIVEARAKPRTGGCAVEMAGLCVVAAGHVILQDVNLRIEPGSHVAIVGPSGAGKSSLVGLLLGWHRAGSGMLLIDGEPLDAEGLQRLRSEVVWVDPQVQLWNRSLFENLRYGVPPGAALPMERVMETAGIASVIQKLPQGMQSVLGEGGALVSGGEGQRVRIARGAARENIRLVILDEPARGLDRERRQAVVAQARELWKNATLLSISHDIGDTLGFPRVLVIDQARIAEDGDPAKLAADPHSRYRQLLDAEETVRRSLWSSERWRRLRLSGGKLVETERAGKLHAS